jgi:hypothetical protein
MAIGSTTSSQAQKSSAVNWLLPPIADLFFVSLLGLLTCTALSVRLLGDAGIGWHIRTGQIILATHAIPHADPFSTLSGQPWFAWEWLYDWLVGWLEAAAGLNAVVLFTALVIAAVFSWSFRLLILRGTNVLLAVVLVLLAASASMIHFLARPHVLSWFFALAWFWILDSFESPPAGPKARSKRLVYWLPITMLLWVNLHGGFLLGFALLGIYWASATWQSLTPAADRFEDVLNKIQAGKRARTLLLAGGLSALATLFNPYGWRLHVHIYRYLSNRFLMDHIDEFQSPNFHYVAQKCFAALLLLALIALAVKVEPRTASSGELSGNISVSHALIVLFAIYSGLYASRNIPVSSILLVSVIGPRLSDALENLADRLRWSSATSFSQRMQTMQSSVRGHLWPVAAVALTCWIAAHDGKLGATPLMNAHFSEKRFPVAAVDSLLQQNTQGAILSPDFWGGYLIYRLHLRMQVVVDDRHDFYGEQFLKSYLKMVNAEPGWKDFLQQHPTRYVLLRKDSALANLLLETPGYTPIYRDEVAIAFSFADHPSK